MRKKIFALGICLALSLVVLAMPFLVGAQESIIDPTNAKYAKGNYDLNDILSLATWAAKWILGIVGSLTLLMFIYGGFIFLTSAGSKEKVGEAQKIITAAVVGLIIVFASYMIIQFVLVDALGLSWSGKELKTSGSISTTATSDSAKLDSAKLDSAKTAVTEDTCKNTISKTDKNKTLGSLGFACLADKTKGGYCLDGLCPSGATCCAPACSSKGTGWGCTTKTAGKECVKNLCKSGTCCK